MRITRKKFKEINDRLISLGFSKVFNVNRFTRQYDWRHDIRVCLPMVCKQMNGWSDNEKTIRDWTEKEKDKPFF